MDSTRRRKSLLWELKRKVQALPQIRPDLRYAVAVREAVENGDGVLAITDDDIFGTSGAIFGIVEPGGHVGSARSESF